MLVRAEAREPSFQATLSWLDATVTDDRIIAAALELQRRHPTDRVVLLTGDVNLLAKADVAGPPTADTPDPDPGEELGGRGRRLAPAESSPVDGRAASGEGS